MRAHSLLQFALLFAIGEMFVACAPRIQGKAQYVPSPTTTTTGTSGPAALGDPANLYLTGPTSIATTDCAPLALSVKDAAQNTVILATTLTVDLITSGSGAFYGAADCASPLGSVSFAAGENTKVVYYKNPTAQAVVLLANSATLFPGNALKVTVSTSNNRVSLAAVSQYLALNTCSSAVSVHSLSADGSAVAVSAATTVGLTGSGTTSFYATAGCGGMPVNSVDIPVNQSSATVYFKDTAAETQLIGATVTGWTAGSLALTTYGPLTVTPTTKTLATTHTATFIGGGGVPPYLYTKVDGTLATCAVGASTGLYTAPVATGTCSVRVTDQLGQHTDAVVTVVSNLQISPTTLAIRTGGSKVFTATGGDASYVYSVVTGSCGSFTPGTGIYAAPGSAPTGTCAIRVTDGLGNTSDATVSVLPSPVVQFSFEENANNWGLNTGSSSGGHSRWAMNARPYPVFSSNHPSGTSSAAAIDFGDGTGWGSTPDGAVDLVEGGGTRVDYFIDSGYANFSAPIYATRVEAMPNLSFTLTPWSPTIPLTNSGTSAASFAMRNFGRVMSPTSDSYTYETVIGNDSGGSSLTQVYDLTLNGTPNLLSKPSTGYNGYLDQLTSTAQAQTANWMSDVKASFVNTYGGGSPQIHYATTWTTSGTGAFPTAATIPSGDLWAPTPATELSALTSFTICGWLNSRSAAADSTVIASWLSSTGGGVELRYRNDGSLQLGINQATTVGGTPRSSVGRVTTDATAATANWVFFAVTYDSNLSGNEVSYYFGSAGNPASLDSSPSYARGTLAVSTAELTLGNFNTSSLSQREAGANVYRGLIDEFKIYDQALTLAQIRALQIN